MGKHWAIPVLASILIFGTVSLAFAATPFDPTPLILHNPSLSPNDSFAAVVAISGNNVLIAAASDDTAGTDTGIVHLFDGTTGALLQTFANPNPTTRGIGDGFGLSSSISGNNVLIGTPSADTGAFNAGIAYLFDGTTGAILQTFLNPTPAATDFFGGRVAISGNNVLIAAQHDDTGAFNAGAAYLFDATTGALLQTFLNPTPVANDIFGNTLAISGNNVLIGSPTDDTGAFKAGAAYLFDATTGALLQTFLNPTPDAVDLFASSLAISGNNVIVSANADDTGATDAGIAYLFDGTTGAILQTFLSPTPGVFDLFGTVAISENNVLIGVARDDTDGTDVGLAYLYTATSPPETPQEQIQDLIDDIGAELPEDIAQSLAAPLENAIKLLDDDNPKNDGAVCGKLGAVDNKIDAKEGKKKNGLTSEQADALRAQLESIKTSLGCV